MSDSPILSKMDALMKKHRGGSDTPAPQSADAPAPVATRDASLTDTSPPDASTRPVGAPPAGAWLPVLTQVIERGTPPLAAPAKPVPSASDEAPASAVAEAAPAPAAAPPAETIDAAPAVPAPDAEPADAPAHSDDEPAIVSSELSEQLMSELTPRLSEVMEKQLAAELRKNLDQTVATLLSQLDVNVREIVREAVAEKLGQPRDPSR